MPEWHIKPAFAIKSNHPIKAGTIQEEKIKRLMRRIEPISYLIVIHFSLLSEFFAFPHEKFTRQTWGNLTAINRGIEGNDMGIIITEQRDMRGKIESNDTRPDKWLNPPPGSIPLHDIVDPGNEFTFNALAFDGRNRHRHEASSRSTRCVGRVTIWVGSPPRYRTKSSNRRMIRVLPSSADMVMTL